MSGSSLDGIDLAYCRFSITEDDAFDWELIIGETLPIPENWKARLAHLPIQNAETFAKTHVYFGHFLAKCVNHFMQRHAISNLDFISSHGHTIFHNPDKRFTSQIGCGSALAALTGYPVINDFRMQDIAINGEGTPIAPAADRYLFSEFDFCLNIGGIANITSLLNESPVAYDAEASVEDRLYTAVHFIANEISQDIIKLIGDKTSEKYKLLVTGGGANNVYLITRIQSMLPSELNVELIVPTKDVIDFKEAILMAFMGVLRVLNKPNCFSSVTGASFDTIGGAIHQGHKKQIT